MMDEWKVVKVKYRCDWRLMLRITLGITVVIPIRLVEVSMSFVADTFRGIAQVCRHTVELVNRKLPQPKPQFYDVDGNEVHNVNYKMDEDGNLTIYV